MAVSDQEIMGAAKRTGRMQGFQIPQEVFQAGIAQGGTPSGNEPQAQRPNPAQVVGAHQVEPGQHLSCTALSPVRSEYRAKYRATAGEPDGG